MKKVILVFCIFFFFICKTNLAQEFLGYANSNYAGVTGIQLQPASIVDSRYAFDMNLAGINIAFGNNFIGVKRKELFQDLKIKFDTIIWTGNDSMFNDIYLLENPKRDPRNVFFNINAYLPSFMIGLSNKHSIAITTNMRTIFNINKLDADLATFLYQELDIPSYWNLNLENDDVNIQSMAWGEIGLTYGRVILNKEKHFLKAAVRVKYIQGLISAYFFANDLNYLFYNGDSIHLENTTYNLGHSDGYEFIDDFWTYLNTSEPSVGFDVGVVYEYRPDHEDYIYEMDGRDDRIRNDKNKYKFKIGLSLTDLGFVNFKSGIFSHKFSTSTLDMNISSISLDGITEIDSFIQANFFYEPVDGKYTMSLPTALSMQLDYNFGKNFYINLTPYYGLKLHKSGVNQLSMLSITPRWDHKWFGVFVPFMVNEYKQMNLGVSLRLGPLVLGTSNLSSLLWKEAIYGLDFHAALKFFVFKPKPKDKDGDKVSNRKDDCKDVPGLWEFKGCPDTDGDGIYDNEDDCPREPGLAEFNGCPDRDKDGIPDKDDECPDEPGLKENNGCPEEVGDTDEDGILDDEDDCPTIPGVIENNGCPEIEKEEQAIVDTAFINLEFGTNNAIIKAKSFVSLERLAALLDENPEYNLKLVGHTDNIGGDAFNMDLSRRRAEAVKNFLIERKESITPNRIKVKYFGERKPIGDNNTAKGRQMNRRVEMNIALE